MGTDQNPMIIDAMMRSLPKCRAEASRLMLMLLVLFTASSCNDKGTEPDAGLPQLDAAVDGRTFQYQQDQRFTLALDSYADAGYMWDWDISDTLVVSTDGNPTYKSNNPDLCGGLCTATFRFYTKIAGYCVVTLIEHQRWMKNDPPLHVVRFSIVVR